MGERIVVVNPAAASGRAAEVWRSLVSIGVGDVVVIEADSPEAARRKLATAVLEHNVEAVVAVGGDGTVHSVANFLLDHGLAPRVGLAMVPAGTGSDLARVLGAPSDPQAAWQRAQSGEARPLDAIRLTTGGEKRWVVNISSFGLPGTVGERVNATEKRGRSVYIVETLRAIRRSQPVHCRIHTDGQLWYEGDVLLAAVANGSEFGAGMKIAPHAKFDDGWLDVVVAEGMSRPAQLLALPRVLRGTHLTMRRVHSRRARRVDIEPIGEAPPYELDGELLPSGPASYEVAPEALRVIV